MPGSLEIGGMLRRYSARTAGLRSGSEIVGSSVRHCAQIFLHSYVRQYAATTRMHGVTELADPPCGCCAGLSREEPSGDPEHGRRARRRARFPRPDGHRPVREKIAGRAAEPTGAHSSSGPTPSPRTAPPPAPPQDRARCTRPLEGYASGPETPTGTSGFGITARVPVTPPGPSGHRAAARRERL